MDKSEIVEKALLDGFISFAESLLISLKTKQKPRACKQPKPKAIRGGRNGG